MAICARYLSPSRRLVRASSYLRASVLPPHAGSPPPEPPPGPIVFDIFDAPVTLGELSNILPEERGRGRLHRPHRSPPPPSPLPAPILFDGPSRPRNLPKGWRSSARPPRDKQVRLASTTSTMPMSTSPEIIVEMFDGPARIHTRRGAQHQGERSNVVLFLGVAGGVSCMIGVLKYVSMIMPGRPRWHWPTHINKNLSM